MTARRIFTGTSYFPRLREDKTVYVDKTALVHRMVHADTAFFLSRPRRFGKSLLVTTLEAYFQGRKELFEGLAMEKLERDWVEYPVLRFDMSGTKYVKPENLEERLNVMLFRYEKRYGREPYEQEPGSRLNGLIWRAKEKCKGRNVVVLVDEYDAPLLDTVMDAASFENMRTMLRSFYSPLKESAEHLRFVFLTGITKFSQLSIFSELNNLNTISMDDEYACICGLTEEEIRTQLRPEVEVLAKKYSVDFEEAMNLLKRKYDGYHFTETSPDIYNPYSLLKCLQKSKLDNYWYASGTPTHLTEMLSKYSLRPEELEGFYADVSMFDAPTEQAESPIPILYQSGYLTIRGHEDSEYILGFPNEEVRLGFLRGLMPWYCGGTVEKNVVFLGKLTRALKRQDIEQAMQLLRSFFSSIPYDAEKQDEAHFKTVFYLLFSLALEFEVRTEERSAAGRCDAVVETKDAVFVFEFKLRGTAQEALAQIDERGYMIPYEAGGKALYKIGACFDEELRTLKEWLVADGGERGGGQGETS